MRLGNVVIYTPDVPKAVHFYANAFGLKERFVAPNGDYGEMETGATALGFVSETLSGSGNRDIRPNRPTEGAAAAKVALVVDDVDAAFQHALDNGASRYGDPVKKPWGQTVAYVRDLNGFIVELCDEAKPSA